MTATPPRERAYRGQGLQAREADRERRFVDAAVSNFARKGFAQTSVADILRSSGLSRRQFYESFSDKEDVLRKAYDTIHSAAQSAVGEAVSAGDPDSLEDLVRTVIRAYVESLDGPERIQTIFVEAVGVSPAFELHRRQMREQWADLIVALLDTTADRAGRESHRMSRWQARGFVASVNAFVLEWTSQGDVPLDDLADTMGTLLIALIGDEAP